MDYWDAVYWHAVYWDALLGWLDSSPCHRWSPAHHWPFPVDQDVRGTNSILEGNRAVAT